ncbi:Na+/H+ antiporter NhaA [Actinocatenispora sera]|uniref:Na(+)/H(+) antiporter NhaA n=1 Tax=Actinocatenispora sera TaxID=390989 RepID=A0A810L2I3_9ACTN|nr:Na+/H+ antiporter NhaA [Actinocatenispora sera]BCJ28646.1 Na(+)/H(+) antiporter NhaA 2 [Actinocatenispora sera]
MTASATRPRRTRWSRQLTPPLRAFLHTESVSAGILVAAIVAALAWANLGNASYEAVWHTELSVRFGNVGEALDLRTWLNSGLMTLFFLVVGLEARREADLGELRDRRRFLLPLVAGVSGMALPVAIYLAANAGRAGAHGWGVAMSTDTALALGLFAVVGRGLPSQLRAFLLTVFVVDDLVALVVIVAAYSQGISVLPLLVAAAAFAAFIGLLLLRIDLPVLYVLLGAAMWAALLRSGVDPVVSGLGIGLLAWAYPPTRRDLERATGVFRLFREQPMAELARTVSTSVAATLSPNDRLQRVFHPLASCVIVPLFVLANAGIQLHGNVLAHAFTAPVTLGILIGYVVGKPVGVAGATWLISWLTGGRIRPAVGWAAILGSGTIAGVGFTVSLLIATLAFSGTLLVEAKLGVLSATVVSSLLTWTVFRIVGLLPRERRTAALLGDAGHIADLAVHVDVNRDHVRGSPDAVVTVVEYGDFECPYCGQAEPAMREALQRTDVRFVWRHLPLSDVHPHAQLAAEAAEAAAAQGAFWPMHDLLLARRDRLRMTDLLDYADELGLDRARFADDLNHHVHWARIAQDIESADLSGVAGTPTFFVDGQRHYGVYDPGELVEAIRSAHERAVMMASQTSAG